MGTIIPSIRDGVTVKEALALLAKSHRAFVWVRATPEDGITVEISKAQARRIVEAVAENYPGVNVLARIDEDGDFRIN